MESKAIPKLMRMIKRFEPLIALIIVITLILLCVNLIKYNKLQEEININCGWEEERENYKCFYQCGKEAYVGYVDSLNKSNNLDIEDWASWD